MARDTTLTGPVALVDGGGTGTRLRLLSAGGAVVAETEAGPSSLAFGIVEAWEAVTDAVARATAQAGLGDPSALGLRLWGGFAGAGSAAREAAFRAADPLGCARIVLITDGLAALIGVHGGRPGTVLAVGTGVVALTLTRGGAIRSASGWGFPVGDEGGGAWIGRRAVAALTFHLDGREARDGPLIQSLQAEIGGDYETLQPWLVEAGATAFASLAPLVAAAADEGDAVAEAILRDAVAEVERALGPVDDGGRLAIVGGLAATMTPRLTPALRARLVEPRGSALDGMAHLAVRGWTGEDFRADRARQAAHDRLLA